MREDAIYRRRLHLWAALGRRATRLISVVIRHRVPSFVVGEIFERDADTRTVRSRRLSLPSGSSIDNPALSWLVCRTLVDRARARRPRRRSNERLSLSLRFQ